MSALYALFVLPSLLVLVLVLLTIMATRLPPAAAFSSLPLIVSSDHDQASSLMLKSLLARSGWKPLQPQQQKGDGAEKPQLCTFSAAWAHSSGRALMAQLEGTMLQADEVDVSFEQQFQLPPSGGSSVSDVIFISKHKAASGTPALTAHPIGLPNPAAEAVHGGRAGMMPAPSPRLAPVLRALTRCAASAGLAGEFEVCFEATHHGPFVSRSPCMFVEIGSSEPQWGREDAAEVWATTLGELLGLDGSPQDPDMSPWLLAGTSNYVDVVVGLGGGHYTPKMGDYARKSGALVGHMIASYGLNFEESGAVETAVRRAIAETARSYENFGKGARITALIDKRAFKSAERLLVTNCLDSLGVRYAFKKEELPLMTADADGPELVASASVG